MSSDAEQPLQLYFLPKPPSETIPIPADWKILSNMINDYALDSPVIPLVDYDGEAVKLLINLTEHLKVVAPAAYQMAMDDDFFREFDFTGVDMDFLDNTDGKILNQAFNLSDFLGVDLAKTFFTELYANKIINFRNDVTSIRNLVGGPVLTADECVKNGLPPNDAIWGYLPKLKKTIFGE